MLSAPRQKVSSLINHCSGCVVYWEGWELKAAGSHPSNVFALKETADNWETSLVARDLVAQKAFHIVSTTLNDSTMISDYFILLFCTALFLHKLITVSQHFSLGTAAAVQDLVLLLWVSRQSSTYWMPFHSKREISSVWIDDGAKSWVAHSWLRANVTHCQLFS